MQTTQQDMHNLAEGITVQIVVDGYAVRFAPTIAAAVLVAIHGADAVNQSIEGRQSAFTATWDEVDRLLAA